MGFSLYGKNHYRVADTASRPKGREQALERMRHTSDAAKGCGIRSYAPRLSASDQNRTSANGWVTITSGLGVRRRASSSTPSHVPSGSVDSVRITQYE